MNKALNFFVQSQNASEKVTLFRHQFEITLAKQFGAKFKHFTPDSCDMIFPNEQAAESFERLRTKYVMEILRSEKEDSQQARKR